MKQNKLTHAELEPSAVVVQLEIDICTTSHWRLRFQFPPYEGLKAQNGAHLGKAKQIGFGVVNSFCRACSETQRNQEAAPATASEEVKTEENITSPCSQSTCSPFGTLKLLLWSDSSNFRSFPFGLYRCVVWFSCLILFVYYSINNQFCLLCELYVICSDIDCIYWFMKVDLVLHGYCSTTCNMYLCLLYLDGCIHESGYV